MAVSVSFGLLFAMVLTLFVIPCVYSLVDSLSQKIRAGASRIVIGED
jgi:predicted RND superfamily exporter protein